MLNIKVKYFDKTLPKLTMIDSGDWVDLYTRVDVSLKKGEDILIPLNVALKMPEGYEWHIAPRSSTFKRYHIIQANSFGIVDNSYCGDNDEVMFHAYAVQDTEIPKGTRICQFRLFKSQERLTFSTVEYLEDVDRGGFGSTGK